ncbi:MAG: MFS transporter [Candidatus Latescibacterota bacterium]
MHQQQTLLSILFANFAFFGASAIIVGSALPEIVRDFSWSYADMGAVLAGGSVGYFSSTFLCSLLLRRWGPRLVISGGLVLQALGLAAFGYTPSFWLNLVAMFSLGLGEGGTEVVTNYCLVRIEENGRSNLMNFMHAAFTAGAIVGPLVMGQLIERDLPWQYAFQGLATISLATACIFYFQPFKNLFSETGDKRTHHALGDLMRQPLLLLLTLVILLYVGVEIGVSNWIAEYFVQVVGTSAATGAYMVSFFWVGLLVGRLLVAALYRGERQALFLLGLCLVSTLALALALLDTGIAWRAVCFFACGMGFSAIYPVIVVLAGRYYSDEQELAIGIISTGGGLGAFVFPFAMAALSDQWGVERAFWFYAGTAAAMSAAAAAVLLSIKRT